MKEALLLAHSLFEGSSAKHGSRDHYLVLFSNQLEEAYDAEDTQHLLLLHLVGLCVAPLYHVHPVLISEITHRRAYDVYQVSIRQ